MNASITPTVTLHFGTPELHSLPMKICVCLAAFGCRGSWSAFAVVLTFDLSNVCVKLYGRRLDRNGIGEGNVELLLHTYPDDAAYYFAQ
jgi:uncharacterized PurR-regulated membrane protein YhhQ (DUF165 family)